MQNPSEMALSAIAFGVRRTEAIVWGVARLGFSATRTLVGVAVRAVAGTDSHTPADTSDYEPQPTSPPERSPARGRSQERDPEPSRARSRARDPEPAPARDPDRSPASDPERQRRMALRDEPSADEQQSPHHVLNNPVTDDPDPTEWPDPYDRREDPLDPESDEFVLPGDAPHPPTGSHSTSMPHPSQDPQAERWNGP